MTDIEGGRARNITRRSRKSSRAFRTISEVSQSLNVPQHVLRFWESKFSQIRPLKRGGGRRFYRPEDVLLLEKIKELLYTEGYTIKGVQKLLREKGLKKILGHATALNNVSNKLKEKEQKVLNSTTIQNTNSSITSDDEMTMNGSNSVDTENMADLDHVSLSRLDRLELMSIQDELFSIALALEKIK